MDFHLVGDFNGWQPDPPRDRFIAVEDPYDRDDDDARIRLGSYHLETTLPKGRICFKILQDGSWDHQWSVRHTYNDVPYEITERHFETRHGFAPNLLAYRGAGPAPHAEYDYPGGTRRWDFHPDSQTLTIHERLEHTPGMMVRYWRSFPCGQDAKVSCWYCLPYGYHPDDAFKYDLCLLFDGRELLYGEENGPGPRVRNDPDRQWTRVLDVLARHGLVGPTVTIAVGVPRHIAEVPEDILAGARRAAYLDQDSVLHQALIETVCGEVVPEATEHFNVSGDPGARFLLGHSNGGDMAIGLLAARPECFGGAVAVSPGAASRASALGDLPASVKDRLRIALAYTPNEPTPGFVTRTARVGTVLADAGVDHLVQFLPGGSHDPAAVSKFLPGCLGFVMR